jgi:hypothetical protein
MAKNDEDLLRIWTIYDHPKDQPDQFVARLWLVGDGKLTPTNEMFVADTIEELHRLLPSGLNMIPRSPDDDPVIVETWL